MAFVHGAELIIHNAPFDTGFINSEFRLLGEAAPAVNIESVCTVLDTLKLARKLRPGQKNDLDSLCRHYSIDNSQRSLHGALLDAEILADVYLAMTGGQATLFQDPGEAASAAKQTRIGARHPPARPQSTGARGDPRQRRGVGRTRQDAGRNRQEK